MDGTDPDRPDQPVEVYEHIPWGELNSPAKASKTWLVYLIAGAIAAASVGALIARSAGAVRSTPSVPEPVAVSVPVTAAPAPPPVTVPLTEADLLAATPGRAELSAAARAEWFVTDYFSTGGDPAAHPGVLDALPSGAAVPATGEAVVPSYVDWAAATHIEAVGADRFLVTVVFRPLAVGAEGVYARLPVRAVDVMVQADAAGGTRIVELPMPAALPAGPSPVWPDMTGEVPAAVRSAAGQIGETWGSDVSYVEGSGRPGRWRVVIGVVDEAGIRWPLALWLNDLGDPLMPLTP